MGMRVRVGVEGAIPGSQGSQPPRSRSLATQGFSHGIRRRLHILSLRVGQTSSGIFTSPCEPLALPPDEESGPRNCRVMETQKPTTGENLLPVTKG